MWSESGVSETSSETTPHQPPIRHLLDIMARLRAPDGCPWDREQTHVSIKPQLIEECYEVLEAIDAESPAMLKEELGDLLLHVVFHAQLGREAGHFDFDDLTAGVNEKLIRRHPHVFGDEMKLEDADAVVETWEEIKKREKPERTSPLDGVPRNLPALMRAAKVSKKAAKTGFDWPDKQGPIDKVREEAAELAAETEPDRVEDEFGDMLFAMVNLARHLNVDPEQALTRATNKFQHRFEAMRARLEANGKSLNDYTLAEMDAVWDAVKAEGGNG